MTEWSEYVVVVLFYGNFYECNTTILCFATALLTRSMDEICQKHNVCSALFLNVLKPWTYAHVYFGTETYTWSTKLLFAIRLLSPSPPLLLMAWSIKCWLTYFLWKCIFIPRISFVLCCVYVFYIYTNTLSIIIFTLMECESVNIKYTNITKVYIVAFSDAYTHHARLK